MSVDFNPRREGVHHRESFDNLSQVVQEVAVNRDGGVGENDPFGVDVL